MFLMHSRRMQDIQRQWREFQGQWRVFKTNGGNSRAIESIQA